MKLLSALVVACSFLSVAVRAQFPTGSGLSDCGRNCIIGAVSQDANTLGCPISTGPPNATCFCGKPAFVYNVRDCAVQSCPSEADTFLVALTGYCAGLGVDVSGETATGSAGPTSTGTATNGGSSTSIPGSSTTATDQTQTTSSTSSTTPPPSSGMAQTSTTLSTSISRTSSITAAQGTMMSGSTTPSNPPSSGLSTGEKAGIGVGVTLGSLIALAAFFILWRRRKGLRVGMPMWWRKEKKHELDDTTIKRELEGDYSLDEKLEELPAVVPVEVGPQNLRSSNSIYEIGDTTESKNHAVAKTDSDSDADSILSVRSRWLNISQNLQNRAPTRPPTGPRQKSDIEDPELTRMKQEIEEVRVEAERLKDLQVLKELEALKEREQELSRAIVDRGLNASNSKMKGNLG